MTGTVINLRTAEIKVEAEAYIVTISGDYNSRCPYCLVRPAKVKILSGQSAGINRISAAYVSRSLGDTEFPTGLSVDLVAKVSGKFERKSRKVGP